jgi:hypothetical protein
MAAYRTANPLFPDFTRTIRIPDVHRTSGNVEQEVLTSTVGVGMRLEIDVRASQHPHICALQTGSRSSIPACHIDLSYALQNMSRTLP